MWLLLSLRVYVADSLISEAGEGLFAKADTEPNTVMAFYNGVRITHTEVREAWTLTATQHMAAHPMGWVFFCFWSTYKFDASGDGLPDVVLISIVSSCVIDSSDHWLIFVFSPWSRNFVLLCIDKAYCLLYYVTAGGQQGLVPQREHNISGRVHSDRRSWTVQQHWEILCFTWAQGQPLIHP